MTSIKKILFIILILLTSGCVTSFTGNAKIIGGRQQCEDICKQWGMELAGMVALGEYSDGCICKVKDKTVSVNDIGETVILSSANAGAGAVGVEMEKRRNQEAQNRSNAIY